MSKLLKLVFSINLIFTFGISFSQNDSVPKHKNQFLVCVNMGIPIYNKFNVTQYGNGSNYWVKSKLKPIYNAGIEYSYKKFNVGLSATYMQNEFIGRNFEYVVADYNNHYYQVRAKYNMYQKVNYNLLQVCLSTGLKFNITPKHLIYVNILCASNLIYKTTINNYYSTDQIGFDTTKYSLVKNASSNQNYGKLPSVGLILAYNCYISKCFILDFKIITQYFSTKNVFNSDDYKENGKLIDVPGYRNTYYTYKHIFIAPTIGIKYKLN